MLNKSKTTLSAVFSFLSTSLLTLPHVKAEDPASFAAIELIDASLSHWDVFMGSPHKSVTGLVEGTPRSEDGMNGVPMGLNNDPKKVFSTFTEDGGVVLKVSGEVYGGLTSKREFKNYHLETEFKWGDKKWEPRLEIIKDSGILYHCHGDHGKFWNVWKASLEYQVQEGDFGDFFGLGDTKVKVRTKSMDNNDVHDPSQPFMEKVSYIQARPEMDKPHGEWNKLEIYVIGDSAIHIVNGEVVLSVADALNSKGEPLTSGQIQLQSEAAECYYRNMKISPIQEYPAVLAKKSGLSVLGGIDQK